MATAPASSSPASPPAEHAPSTPPAPASPVGSAAAAATPPPAEADTADGSAGPPTPRSPGASDAPVEQRPSPPQTTALTPSASDGSVALTSVDLDRLLSSAAAGDSLSHREYQALVGFALPFAPTVDATFSEDLAGADANALVLVPRRPGKPAGKPLTLLEPSSAAASLYAKLSSRFGEFDLLARVVRTARVVAWLSHAWRYGCFLSSVEESMTAAALAESGGWSLLGCEGDPQPWWQLLRACASDDPTLIPDGTAFQAYRAVSSGRRPPSSPPVSPSAWAVGKYGTASLDEPVTSSAKCVGSKRARSLVLDSDEEQKGEDGSDSSVEVVLPPSRRRRRCSSATNEMMHGIIVQEANASGSSAKAGDESPSSDNDSHRRRPTTPTPTKRQPAKQSPQITQLCGVGPAGGVHESSLLSWSPREPPAILPLFPVAGMSAKHRYQVMGFPTQLVPSQSPYFPNYEVVRAFASQVRGRYGDDGVSRLREFYATRPWDAMWRGRVRHFCLIDPHRLSDSQLIWLDDVFLFMFEYRQALWMRNHWLHISREWESEWLNVYTRRLALDDALRREFRKLKARMPAGITDMIWHEPVIWAPPARPCQCFLLPGPWDAEDYVPTSFDTSTTGSPGPSYYTDSPSVSAASGDEDDGYEATKSDDEGKSAVATSI
ncbi:hypothetical protein P43SY_011298 [Pythium insidiosum]|uniref:Uncharacterized protein n=1 Tax=Pythium insidiosum TaxID=114742 RepID=A0AAD5LSI8_PYTIN|nr:hypothetical protein P43SY_011298 [Pythium insidiosum]